jgi:hypothetical protein
MLFKKALTRESVHSTKKHDITSCNKNELQSTFSNKKKALPPERKGFDFLFSYCLFFFIEAHCFFGCKQQFIFFLASYNHVFEFT